MRGFLVSLHKALCIEISKSFRFKKSCVDYVSVEVVDYSMNYITRRVGLSPKHSHSTVVFWA